MGHFGFSFVGLLWLCMLIVPNLFWSRCRPEGYDPSGENKVLAALEKCGQAGVSCTSLFFCDYDAPLQFPWALLLVFSFALMLLYELWWLRYFKSEKALGDMYSSFLGIPVAGATLPVLAFLLLGVYGRVLWLVLSVLVLGVGHIGIHLEHRKNL